jgi:hypothetical protein
VAIPHSDCGKSLDNFRMVRKWPIQLARFNG